MALHLHFKLPRGTRQITIILDRPDAPSDGAQVVALRTPLPAWPTGRHPLRPGAEWCRSGAYFGAAQRFAPAPLRHDVRAWYARHAPPNARP